MQQKYMEELELDLDLDFGGIEDFELNDDLPLELEEVVENQNEPVTEVVSTEEVTEQTQEESNDDLEIAIETSKYFNLASEKIALGEWEDVLVEIDGEEVKLSEFKGLDEETYKQILQEQKNIQKQELEQNFTSVKGLTETQKNLIEIIKSGDYDKAKQLFQEPSNLKEPFQGYDSSDERHNTQVLTAFYKNQGMEDYEIPALIKAVKENGALEDKAIQIVEGAREQFKKKIEEEKIRIQEEKKQEESNKKTYAKDVETHLKELGIESPTLAKKMAQTAIKQTESGILEIDSIYEEKMKDPKEAAELVFWLTNKEEYLKWIKNTSKKEVHREVLKEVKIIRPSARQTKIEPTENNILEFEL